MFDGAYFEWNQKRIKGIVDFYGYKFFYFKRILDLGCGYGDLGGVLYRLGADVTAVDARQDHLKIVNKKYSGIKTVQANLDGTWPFHGQKFDLILDLGLLCHLSNFEKHLKEVCASTTHLVLETAVCDSDDSNHSSPITENKGIYDLSYNGMGCRPSPAAIERVLRECGMNFKRVDNSKYSTGNYTYDWYPKNDNSTSIGKRRIWFAIKDSSPIQFANPSSELALPPVTITSLPQGYIAPIVNSRVPVTSASPRLPISARVEAEAKAQTVANNPQQPDAGPATMPSPSPIHTYLKALPLNDRVRSDSKEFALITPDDFRASVRSDVRAIILPNTYSSRMWFKKIAPLFPNIRLSNKTLTMPGFAKSDAIPDLVMCSLDNLQTHKRIWIDEWFGNGLTSEHLNVLKNCSAIVTPSLINAQEIWKHLPNANVFRVSKPWPAIEASAATGSYFLYFEKSSELTNILLNAWDPQWGNLAVVGSSIKLPAFANFVSDYESYTQIMKLVYGAKGLIDLSENNYYASGIIGMVHKLGLPIISNNQVKLGDNLTLINQDKRVSISPTAGDIQAAMLKFNSERHSVALTSGVTNNNNFLADEIRKMVGT